MQEDLKNAIKTLQNGGIILYPTDTIWGIGCDATNINAVKKVLEIKKSADSKSMLILLNNSSRIYSYVENVPDVAIEIAEISEKPITIIYPDAKNLPENLIADDGSIGIRITKEEFSSNLVQKFKKPIVSTSANISGEKTPLNFSEISDEIKNKVDYVVKYNQEKTNLPVPSSIIKIGAGNQVTIIRK